MNTHDPHPPSSISVQLLAERAWIARLAYRMLHDRDAANDVVQETLLAAVEAPPPTDRSPRGWLARVATNVVRMRHRSDVRRARREDAFDRTPADADAATAVHRAQIAALLAGAVDDLAEPYRSAVRMRFFAERSVAEIAAAQGVPVGTAGWRISEGLDRLRARLDHDTGGDSRPWLMALALPGGGVPAAPASPPAIGSAPTTAAKSPLVAALVATMAAAVVAAVLVLGWFVGRAVPAAPHSTAVVAHASPAVTITPAAWPATASVGALRFGPVAAPRATPAASTTTGGRPAIDPREFELQFSAADGHEGSVTELFGDLEDAERDLMECFVAYGTRTPELPPGGRAAVRLTIVEDATLGPLVTASEVIDAFDDVGDDELKTCLGETGAAMTIARSIGPTGSRREVEIGISRVPARASDSSRWAAIEGCVADLRRRRPDVTWPGKVTDPTFGACMDRASPPPDDGLGSAALAAFEACVKAAGSSMRANDEAVFARCAVETGVTIQPRRDAAPEHADARPSQLR